jgi:hypothetical protein
MRSNLPRVEGSVQQPEDSEDSEDSQDMEPEQENINMDTKLSDDEIVKQFRGRSLSQKLGIFKRVLRQSHHPFILLVKTWIEDTAGDDRGSLRQGKAKQLLNGMMVRMVFCRCLRRRRLFKNESRQAL